MSYLPGIVTDTQKHIHINTHMCTLKPRDPQDHNCSSKDMEVHPKTLFYLILLPLAPRIGLAHRRSSVNTE